MAETPRAERTIIDGETRQILKSFFDRGMTRVGSPLIQEASAATGLNTYVIENWIGNYKRAFKCPSHPPHPPKPKLLTRDLSAYNLFCRDVLKNKGTMKDMRGWSSLSEEDKERYKQEAEALKASSKAQDLSPEMRAQKIKKHLKQLKLEVSKLEELGVETAALSTDYLNPMASVFQVSSQRAAAFLESTDTANKFALHFAGGSSTPATVESVHVLVKKVQDLFNQKYIAAGGSGRLPYQALVNQTLNIQVTGLPNDLMLRKPSFYGRKQLEVILKEADRISFQIETWKEPGDSPADTGQFIPPEVRQVVIKDEASSEQQQWCISPDQGDPEHPHIKEEEEDFWTGLEDKQLQGLHEEDLTNFLFSHVPVKKGDEETAQSTPYESQTEEKREAESPASSSALQVKTEEDCGGSGPSRLLGSGFNDSTSHSAEVETEDSGDSWKEIRKSQINMNTMKTKDSVNDMGCNKLFGCSKCGKRFGQKHHLQTHMRCHTGEKPFSCSLCGKRFAQKGNMTQHLTVHTREKPCSCPVCGERFAQKGNLTQHMTVHTREKLCWRD